MARRWDFDSAIRKFEQTKRQLPRQLGNMALNHYKRSWRNQGFTDEKLDPWQSRKRPSRADLRTGRRRAILVQSGNLRRSGRVKRASFREIRIGFYGLPYASIHNRGLRGRAFGKHPFTMPERKFIGPSRVLTRRLRNRINRELKNVFK